MGNPIPWGVGFLVAAFALDQGTKAFVLAYEHVLSAGIDVLPFMRFELIRNTGVSFGLSSGRWASQWPLIFSTAAIIIAPAVWLIRTGNVVTAAAIGAVMGGGLGNIVDRISHGGVTDFIDLHYASHHWPAFNIADGIISLGVAVLLLTSWSKKQNS